MGDVTSGKIAFLLAYFIFVFFVVQLSVMAQYDTTVQSQGAEYSLYGHEYNSSYQTNYSGFTGLPNINRPACVNLLTCPIDTIGLYLGLMNVNSGYTLFNLIVMFPLTLVFFFILIELILAIAMVIAEIIPF